MSYKNKLLALSYQQLFKPVAFKADPEKIHDLMIKVGERLENNPGLLAVLFDPPCPKLKKRVLGLEFENPIGLAAGFDYNGHLAQTMKLVGFGFNTVGTVTAFPSPGNAGQQLARLPHSNSLWVNKGFKSDGAVAIARRLDQKKLADRLVGVSVGASNVPTVRTAKQAIDDYLLTFSLFKNKPYVKYFELNISCPNTCLKDEFSKPGNFAALVKAVVEEKINQPIFVKMPNEISEETSDALVKIALANSLRGFIFSNLVKNKSNPAFNQKEIIPFVGRAGGFSGRPATAGATRLLRHTRQTFGAEVALIGVGGVFNAADARKLFTAGADLVQLITGMIYQGPQLAAQICEELCR